MMTDPIADMLTRIRNAVRVERPIVEMPLSKVKRGLAEVLKREGYIWDWREEEADGQARQAAVHRPEVRPQRRARDPAHQAGQQAGPPGVQPRDRPAAGPERPGHFDHQHQPRRDQRPRSPAEEARRRSAVRIVVVEPSAVSDRCQPERVDESTSGES